LRVKKAEVRINGRYSFNGRRTESEDLDLRPRLLVLP